MHLAFDVKNYAWKIFFWIMGLVKLDLVVLMTNRVKKYKEQAVAELCRGSNT